MANGWRVAAPHDLPRPAGGPAARRRSRGRPVASSASSAVFRKSAADGPRGAHPHVERRAGTEGKSALRLVQLPGRDAEIEQDEVGPEGRARRPSASASAVGRLEVAHAARRPAARRLTAIASGSRSMPSTSAPARRSAAAWPPSPRVASTTRRAPAAAARTGARSTGTCKASSWVGHVRRWGLKRNTPSAGTGWHVQQRERG